MRLQLLREPGSDALLGPYFVHDPRLVVRHDDANRDGLGLPEAPAPSDRLVVGLVRVAETEKDHPMTPLEIQPKARDARLRDEYAGVPAKERHEPRRFLVLVVLARD